MEQTSKEVEERSGGGTKDGNPYGWHAHGRRARGQADHRGLAHMFRKELFISGNSETGVPKLNLASILYMGSPEGLRHFCPPDHTSHSV